MGSGLFEPDKATLEHVRQHLAHDPHPLQTTITAPGFIDYFGTMQGETLKTTPIGYDRHHPAIEWLRYKQFLAVHRFSDADVTDDSLVARFAAACAAMRPFLDYLDKASAPLK